MSSLYGNMGNSPTMGKSLATNGIKTRVPSGLRQYQRFTPEQMGLYQQLFSHTNPDSNTSRLAMGDESAFNQAEAPALRQFNQELGGLASKFSNFGGQGALSARNSSGFQNAATQSASNFAQQLQSNRQNLQRQALSDLLGLSNSLLGANPYEQYMKPQNQGFDWGGALGALGGGAAGFFAGGPMGAVQGAQFGNQIFGRGQQQQQPQSFNFSAFGG